MEKQKITFSQVCAWFFVFVFAFFAILTLVNSTATLFCMIMMGLDNGTVDHYWNCGVLIYGVYFLVCMVFALFSWALSYPVLKDNWWEAPIIKIKATVVPLWGRFIAFAANFE